MIRYIYFVKSLWEKYQAEWDNILFRMILATSNRNPSANLQIIIKYKVLKLKYNNILLKYQVLLLLPYLVGWRLLRIKVW